MESHTVLCHELLQKMAVPTYSNTFILGSFARRVTLRSQQVRALNLIHSLVTTGKITSDKKALIVGAGFAGLTATAAALRAGCSVTVLEQSASSLSLQRNCRHRYLHPNIFDWPTEGSSNPNADLPLLNWTAELSDRVVAHLDSEFVRTIRQAKSGYRAIFRVEAINILPTGAVLWSEANANRREDFDVVILAIGFGLENPELGPGYWADSPIDQNTSDSKDLKVLVSGNGDGALADLSRLCIADFRPERILSMLESVPRIKFIEKQVLEIENSLESRDPAFLSRMYQDPLMAVNLPWRLRDTSVVWAPGSTEMFTPNSSALNRFVVSQLFHAGAFKLLSKSRIERVQQTAGGNLVTFTSGNTEQFNSVIRRHGPVPALDKSFPDLAKVSAPTQGYWASAQSDWTNRIVLERENFVRPIRIPDHGGAEDPLHASDLEAAKSSQFKISSVVNGETIIIVVGTGFWTELVDRPAAALLQKAIAALGNNRFRRGIIVSDFNFEGIPEIQQNAILSIGGPNVNRLTALLKDKSPYQVSSGVWGAWEMHSGMPRVALWGEDPNGAVRTLQSVRNYLGKSDGLEAFLRQCWK